MENLFSVNLSYYKKKKYFKNSDIADIINMSAPSVGNLLKGSTLPTSETLIILSNEFGCTIDDLLKVDLSKAKKTYNSSDQSNAVHEENALPLTGKQKKGKEKTPVEDFIKETIRQEVLAQTQTLRDKVDLLQILSSVDNEIANANKKEKNA